MFIVVRTECDIIIADLDKQRSRAKFCFKRGKTVSEKQEILKTDFDEYITKRTQNFEWFSLSKCGENSAEDSIRSDSPSTGHTKVKS
jgi:hypothetical protein